MVQNRLRLPIELWLRILDLLDFKDHQALSRTSHMHRQLTISRLFRKQWVGMNNSSQTGHIASLEYMVSSRLAPLVQVVTVVDFHIEAKSRRVDRDLKRIVRGLRKLPNLRTLRLHKIIMSRALYKFIATHSTLKELVVDGWCIWFDESLFKNRKVVATVRLESITEVFPVWTFYPSDIILSSRETLRTLHIFTTGFVYAVGDGDRAPGEHLSRSLLPHLTAFGGNCLAAEGVAEFRFMLTWMTTVTTLDLGECSTQAVRNLPPRSLPLLRTLTSSYDIFFHLYHGRKISTFTAFNRKGGLIEEPAVQTLDTFCDRMRHAEEGVYLEHLQLYSNQSLKSNTKHLASILHSCRTLSLSIPQISSLRVRLPLL